MQDATTTDNSNEDKNKESGDSSPLNPAKRLRVSDIDISRYREEFLELREIAHGEFGQVKIARHRLDGMVYAIKVTRTRLFNNKQAERAAMNEVFAHAALMRHKHVVRYYNSWVENGRIFIQNEFCEGGSLTLAIDRRRAEGKPFTESELRRIVSHLAKGLQYIHSKQLVHLDIKPDNVFLAMEYSASSPSDNEEDKTCSPPNPKPEPQPETKAADSTDSGNHSDHNQARTPPNSIFSMSPTNGVVSYKIGDLGHVAPLHGDYIPEEGDCRYMAPELLLHHVDRERLAKADIFSLGLTLYECATLTHLPKNSIEDPSYEKMRQHGVPYLRSYSSEFNRLLKLMTANDLMTRPSAQRILSHPFVKTKKASPTMTTPPLATSTDEEPTPSTSTAKKRSAAEMTEADIYQDIVATRKRLRHLRRSLALKKKKESLVDLTIN